MWMKMFVGLCLCVREKIVRKKKEKEEEANVKGKFTEPSEKKKSNVAAVALTVSPSMYV